MEKDHKDCGKCIFCVSKCPECESTNVQIQYRVNFRYSNDEEDEITIESEYGYSQILCEDCGERVSPGDNRLEKLDSVLSGLRPKPMVITIENRKIDIWETEVIIDNWVSAENLK